MSCSTSLFDSVPLHQHAEFMESCVEVLREEWTRSAASRLSMLEKSNDCLPYSIVLIKRSPDSGTSELIGHSRLCKIFREPRAAFVESVVIRKDHRGLGLGRKLMEETEKHARKLGLTVLYLSTHDKQDFYLHIGYQLCPPVVSFGSASGLLSEEKLSKLVEGLGMPLIDPTECNVEQSSNINGHRFDEGTSVVTDSSASTSYVSRSQPPPPPPPPFLLPSAPKTPVTKISCSWMKKQFNSC